MRKERCSLLCLILICLNFSLSAQSLAVSMTTTAACSLSGTATATVTTGMPPYTYQWYGPNGQLPFIITNTATGLHGGYYSVVVTDANQQWGTAGGMVAMPFTVAMSATNDVCNGSVGTATASVTAGGTPPFTYLWGNGQTTATATGLSSGTYAITVTDAAGCFVASYMDSTVYAYVYNSSPLNITLSSTNSTCNDGTATVANITGGTPPYTYSWSNGQTTSSITNLAPGWYGVTVSDGSGCADVAGINIFQLPGGLDDTLTVTDANCGLANGAISLIVSGGTAPYSYLWSNGATTANITGLVSGVYTVTITDNNGCTKVSSEYVANNSGLQLSMTPVQPTCNMTNGSLQVNVTGGTPPFTYAWSTGATTANITGIGAGSYDVTVSDASSCTNTLSYMLTATGCDVTIAGRVMEDLNADCIFNGLDAGMGGIIVDISGYWAVTDSLGYYSRTLPPANYVVTEGTLPLYYAQVCPVGPINVAALTNGATYGGNDFYNSMPANINDLRLWFYAGPARATAPQYVVMHYQNVGSTTLSATIEFTHDALMSLVSGGTNLTSYNSGTRVLTYSLGAVPPGGDGSRECYFSIPPGTTIGTGYTHSATLFPTAGDMTPADNVRSYSGVVLGPYDPNRKLVLPEGLLEPGVDSLLEYTVEFQNVGNDTAMTVVIRDTLDGDLDPLSIEVLGSSHGMTWTIDAPGYLTFTFSNIRLPDSTTNEPASHGWLSYRIRLKDNLPLGTQIRNTAAIYFDFNAPVITNTTLNTFDVVAVDPGLGRGTVDIVLYPNPIAAATGNHQVELRLKGDWEGETQVRMMDLSGRVVWTAQLPDDMQAQNIEVARLPQGVYLVECRSEVQRVLKKLIIY